MKKGLIIIALATFIYTCQAQESFRDGIFLCQKIESDASAVCIELADIQNGKDSIPSILIIPQKVRCGNNQFEVREIADNGFSGCNYIEHVIISEGVKQIGENCFRNCIQLRKVEIPASVIYVSSGVLADCPELESISVSPRNNTYDSRNNCNAIIETSSNKLIAGCSTTTIPSSVVSINSYAFWGCTSLNQIILPEGIEEIECMAFGKCYNLESIIFPQSLLVIDGDAFCGCQSLQKVIIPQNVESIIYNPFTNCPALSSITVDANNNFYDSRDSCNAIVETATESVIVGCANTVIPTSAKRLSMFAFKGVNRLTGINIPASINKIEEGSIVECPSLVSITVDSLNKTYDSRKECNCIIETATRTLVSGCVTSTFPENIRAIGNYAFCGMMTKAYLELPNTLERIGLFSFSNCQNLRQIKIPSSIKQMHQSFVNCCQLVNVVFEPGFTEIPGVIFCNCVSLSSIVLPEGIKVIGESAFAGCTRLSRVTLPSTIVNIEKNAFEGCLFKTSND